MSVVKYTLRVTEYEQFLFTSYCLNACHAWAKKPAWILALAEVAEDWSEEFGLSYKFPKTASRSKDAQKGTKAERRKRLTVKNIKHLEDYFQRVKARYESKKALVEEYKFLDELLLHL